VDGGQGRWRGRLGRGGRGEQELGGGGLGREHEAGGEGGPGFLLGLVQLTEVEGLSLDDLAGGGALVFDEAPLGVVLGVLVARVTTVQRQLFLPTGDN